MAKVHCFDKKHIFSMAKNKDFYFACVRDERGYSGDQIINKDLFDALPPKPDLDLDVSLDCSGSRPFVALRIMR